VSRYTVYVIPHAWKEIKDLPGNMRQRVKRAIEALADNPRPPRSKALDTPDFEHELRRLRLDRWRIVYAVTETNKAVDVLTVRKRPPYDYGDLGQLLAEAQ
jgi:mRNA interferase RelE/StbE